MRLRRLTRLALGLLRKVSIVAALIGLHAPLASAEDCKEPCDARRKQCEVTTAAVVAGVRGTTIAPVTGEDIEEGWRELSHPNATGFSIYCGKDGIAVNAEWKDAFPPAAFFDLVSQAGSIVTGHPLSGIQSGAARCHQQALVDEDHMLETKIDGVIYQCKAGEVWGGTSITIIRQQPPQE
jgi:hypothetical protein